MAKCRGGSGCSSIESVFPFPADITAIDKVGELVLDARVPAEILVDGQTVGQLFVPGVVAFGVPAGVRTIRVYTNGTPTDLEVVVPENGSLEVFVELRDVNYPGSNYTLIYDREKDLLAGVYFQATMQQTYDVTFSRMRPER